MNYKVAWKPLPGSQSLSLSCPCNEILYEGTRGPGKTAAQLARFRRNVGLGYGSFWRGVIFDTEYKNLTDIITQSKRMYRMFNDGARYLASASELRWVWPTGEELLFRFGKEESDYWDYHGQEFPFIGFNELTKQQSQEFYEMMFSCRRSSFRPENYPLDDGKLLPPIPLETFSTTNPFGIGHTWVKRRFIDPAPRGTIIRETQKVFNPQTEKEEDVTLTRVAIHGSFKENPYLDPQYVATLMAIKDPNRRKAWVEGSWDVTSGGRFDHLWNESLHVIKPFKIPDSWTVDRSHDWGESKPFSNLWWAQSDGTAATLEDGRKFCPPAKSLILIGEWYGCPPDELNKGLNMSSTNVAKGVAWIDKRLAGDDVEEPEEIKLGGVTQGQMHIIPGICKRVIPGPADGAIYNSNDNELSIADKMKAVGVEWIEANKSPGSRINGAALFADMLEAVIEAKNTESGIPEKPAFYVFDICRGWISRIPVLVRDDKKPDDVDTQQEDHDWDGTRYRVLHSPRKTGAIFFT
ncbi:terminase [Salmonella enterica subsp. enterica serovar Montevideo]|nr:terminase [Salmonella enterica]EBV4312681.1 terminase [Salmonella enterica subsp. enterica serovar Livingstone]EBZ6683750.1 terminase [Salmonella enterica subsp. enterica serovar Mbandaka]ECZ5462242.1 terminase [Salmonella enterica subsp. enterica serovar Montevideo]EDW2698433.1 terminase [Salmonella enterica subsp. enterica serovar Ohio]